MNDNEVLLCCKCMHAKRRFFEWLCTCPELNCDNIDFVNGKRKKRFESCKRNRFGRFCPCYSPRSFAPPRKNPNEIPPLPPRSFVPPKETPMHKAPPKHEAPPMEDKIDGCDSCTWHQPGAFDGRVMYHVCKHEKSKWEGWYNLQCIDMRTNEDFCGKEKRLYKPKDQAK